MATIMKRSFPILPFTSPRDIILAYLHLPERYFQVWGNRFIFRLPSSCEHGHLFYQRANGGARKTTFVSHGKGKNIVT